MISNFRLFIGHMTKYSNYNYLILQFSVQLKFTINDKFQRSPCQHYLFIGICLLTRGEPQHLVPGPFPTSGPKTFPEIPQHLVPGPFCVVPSSVTGPVGRYPRTAPPACTGIPLARTWAPLQPGQSPRPGLG